MARQEGRRRIARWVWMAVMILGVLAVEAKERGDENLGPPRLEDIKVSLSIEKKIVRGMDTNGKRNESASVKLASLGGCHCLDEWEHKGVKFTYPDNCRDPSGAGFEWCKTVSSENCKGLDGYTSWDRCKKTNGDSILRKRSGSKIGKVNNNEQTISGKRSEHSNYQGAIGNHESCSCYPGRGTCMGNACVCKDPDRYMGDMCEQCGPGYFGPECKADSPFEGITGLLYGLIIFGGVIFGCCIGACMSSSGRDSIIEIGRFARSPTRWWEEQERQRRWRENMKEFDFDASMLGRDSTKLTSRHGSNGIDTRRDGKAKRHHRPQPNQQADEGSSTSMEQIVLVDLEDGKTGEHARNGLPPASVEESLLSSLNEFGDFELEGSEDSVDM